jgi:hypothetical protein
MEREDPDAKMIHEDTRRNTKGKRVDLLYKEEVFSIIGAAIEVHKELGPGFLEAVYQEALEMELSAREVPFLSQSQITIEYKGKRIAKNTLLISSVSIRSLSN